MIHSPKLLLALVTAVIFGSAVGLPISFSVQKGMRNSATAQTGGGGGANSGLQLKKCSSSDSVYSTSVAYGDSTAKDVCWSTETESTTSSAVSAADSQYTDLFKKMWPNKSSSWSSTSDNTWRNQCTNGSGYQFVIQTVSSQGGNNPEYIGTCSSSSSADNQAWVSIENKASNTIQLKVCQGSSCWSTSSTSSNIHSLSNASGSWSPVTFKKKA